MAAERIRQVRYTASITAATLERFQQVIRVWDTPQSRLEGARVVQAITAPVTVDVMAEQLERFSAKPERAKIRHQGKEGWVLAIQLSPTA